MKERTRCQWGVAAAAKADAEAETAEAAEASLRAMARTERWRYERERRVPMASPWTALWKYRVRVRVRACNDVQVLWTPLGSLTATPCPRAGHRGAWANKKRETKSRSRRRSQLGRLEGLPLCNVEGGGGMEVLVVVVQIRVSRD